MSDPTGRAFIVRPFGEKSNTRGDKPINFDKVDKMRGMNITFVTSTSSDEEAHTLLAMMGMPYRREEEKSAGAA